MKSTIKHRGVSSSCSGWLDLYSGWSCPELCWEVHEVTTSWTNGNDKGSVTSAFCSTKPPHIQPWKKDMMSHFDWESDAPAQCNVGLNMVIKNKNQFATKLSGPCTAYRVWGRGKFRQNLWKHLCGCTMNVYGFKGAGFGIPFIFMSSRVTCICFWLTDPPILFCTEFNLTEHKHRKLWKYWLFISFYNYMVK